MSGRAIAGIYIDGKFCVSYQYFDGYPAELGYKLVQQIKIAIDYNRYEKWRRWAKDMDPITRSEDTEVYEYPFDIEDDLLARRQPINWCDSDGQPLWQPHGYILNFDTNTFDYYNYDRLIAKFPLNDLPVWQLIYQLPPTDAPAAIDNNQ